MIIITWIINTWNWWISRSFVVDIFILWVMALAALGLSDLSGDTDKSYNQKFKRL